MKDFKTKNGFFTGNVGIGTTDPDANLHVGSGIGTKSIKIKSGGGASGDLIFDSASNEGMVRYEHTTDSMRLHTNGSEKMRIDSSGNVGIGANDPKGLLDINASDKDALVDLSNAEGYAIVVRNNSTTDKGNGIAFTNDDADHVGGAILHIDKGSNNLGDLAFYTKETSAGSPQERMRIGSSGNVGIGTTSPASRFHVNTASSGDEALRLQNAGGVERVRVELGSGTAQIIGDNSLFTIRSTDGSLAFDTSSNERMRIDSNGNVGIGNTNPSHNLTLGSATSTGTTSARLKVYRGADDSGQNLEMGFNHITVTRDSNPLSSAQSTFSIKQKGSDGERVAIQVDTSGNVGIGTASPICDLDIHGTLLFSTTPTNSEWMFETGATSFGIKEKVGSSFTSRVTFKDGGNVGIGTANPVTRLDVAADPSNPWAMQIERADNSGQNSGRVFFDSSSGAWCLVNENGNFQLRWNGTPGSSSGTSKLQVVANANAWTAVSDERLKENISEISNALDIIKDKRCTRFNYADDSDKRKTVGFIAQDWVDDLPEVVNVSKGLDVDDENDTDEYFGLEYQGIIPVITKAIQEQQQIIEDLKSQNESLAARISALES